MPLLEQREYPAIAVRPAQFGDHRQVEQIAEFCHELRTGPKARASVPAQWPKYLRFRRAAVRATAEHRLRSRRQTGRASCRERTCEYTLICGVSASTKKHK